MPNDTDSNLSENFNELPTAYRNKNKRSPPSKSKKLISSIYFLLPNNKLKIEFKKITKISK